MSINIWTIQLDSLVDRQQEFMSLLSEEELRRARAYVTPQLNARYVAAHGALRIILANALDVAPASIEFFTTKRGKPFLKQSSLFFNLAHSQDIALVGLCHRDEIGVDIERVNGAIIDKGVNKSVFRAEELEALSAIPVSARSEAFYWTWTAKEALLKLIGQGLHKDMREFAVPITQSVGEAEVMLNERPRYLRTFRVNDECIGAVALNHPCQTISIKPFEG